MANAALLIDNLADAGSLTASAELAGLEVANLITSPHVWQDQWRASGSSAYFTLDLGSDMSVDTVVLLGLILSANATIRLRLSTSAAGATAGDVLDVTCDADGTNLDPDYGMLALLLSSPTSLRYARFDIDDSSASFICAGRLVVGARESLAYNFSPGGGMGWFDPSIVNESKGGQSLAWERQRYRTVAIDVQWITNTQRWDLVESLMRVNGRTRGVLTILDPEATYLPRETIWGLVTDTTPVVWTAIPDLYSRQFQFKELL